MRKNKKIFLVINKLGGIGWGGAHRVIVILSNYFAKKGYDVNLIVLQKTKIDYPLNKKVTLIQMECCINNEFDILLAWYKIRKLLKKERNVYLIAFMSRMATYARIFTIGLPIKIIGCERTDPKTEPRKRIYRLIRNIAFNYMYKTVYQTPDAMDYFPVKAQKNGYVIPNPLTPNLPQRYEGVRKKEFVTFCRIDQQKNLFMMIDAFCTVHKKYNDFTLKIYGTGLLEEKIKDYINEKNANEYIFMKGFANDVHKKVLKSYAFISSSNYEGLSNSMLEAMAIGLPCICTDCPIGGAKMVIEDGVNGLLVPVKDTKSLVNAMTYLIENPAICQKISKEAAEIKVKLNENEICEKWEQLLNE